MKQHDRRELEKLMSRRGLLRALGAGVGIVGASRLLGCSQMAGMNDGGLSDSALGDTGLIQDASLSDVMMVNGWATGGTAAMQGGYADPFSSGMGTVCDLTCAATLGPCYAQTVTRQDISEGQLGLPVRMAFLVVNESCTPVENATIDIWHTSATGLYSGSDASNMCTLGDSAARNSRWFRGVQTTNASGRADFNTCFPGWYSSRTVHVHFTVRVNNQEYVTSQLFFDDTLTDSIIGSQPIYSARGARDTNNTNDNVIGSASVANYLFQTQRQADGAMLAWKTLVIRSSTSNTLCSIGGGMRG